MAIVAASTSTLSLHTVPKHLLFFKNPYSFIYFYNSKPPFFKTSIESFFMRSDREFCCFVRSDREFLYKVLAEVIKAGATMLNIPYNVGITIPFEFGLRILKLIRLELKMLLFQPPTRMILDSSMYLQFIVYSIMFLVLRIAGLASELFSGCRGCVQVLDRSRLLSMTLANELEMLL